QTLRDHLAVPLGVRDPAGRVGGKVGVFPADGLRADILLQLDQEAALADKHVQREVRLHRVQPITGKKALAERRHPEINERVLEGAAAQAAVAGGRGAHIGWRGGPRLRYSLENCKFHTHSPRALRAPSSWLGLLLSRFSQ